MKIAVYTIAKNEEKNVADWIQSVWGADFVVACDTGSTDKTFEALHEGVDHVWKISIDPWRFDDAHNAALALAPADADICIPLHLDERLTPGWRERIEAVWTKRITKIRYPYKFSEQITFMQSRIHTRKGYRWRYPAHETIVPYLGTVENTTTIPGSEPLITQVQDLTKNRIGLNIPLLREGLLENHDDSRMTYYLGRELFYDGQWNNAIVLLTAYLSVDTRHPQEQRDAAACLYHCYEALAK